MFFSVRSALSYGKSIAGILHKKRARKVKCDHGPSIYEDLQHEFASVAKVRRLISIMLNPATCIANQRLFDD